MRRSFKLHALVIGLFVVWSAGQLLLAQSSGPGQAVTLKRTTAVPISSVVGKDTFTQYCAVCHGKDGKGSGPAAPALKVPPIDLTRLSQNNGGKFDGVKVEGQILGKSKVPPAHGSPEMPIWGPIFRAMSSDTGAEAIRLHNLVDYLKELQK
jgi:mono/diheme cytochrome c family protein